MKIDVRAIGPEEVDEFLRVEGRGFGHHPRPESIERARTSLDVRRSIAAFEGQQIVGTCSSFPFEMALPGGAAASVSGISDVAVQPTHRRRRVLTRVMEQATRTAHERGEPLAALWASEAAIYGRFGYGIAVEGQHVRVDPRDAQFLAEGEVRGQVRFVDAPDAARAWPEVHRRAGAIRPGFIQRLDVQWDALFEPTTGADPAPFLVEYEEGGRVEGYAIYRVRSHWEAGLPASTVTVQELIAVTDRAHGALWRFVLALDLVREVESWHLPVDDPLPWMLRDPRRLRRSISDGLWLRLVDAPVALAARRYSAEGRLVVELHDSLAPWNEGRFRIEADGDGAGCRPDSGSPDLALDATDLGSIFLGGVRPSTLARAGRIEELRPGALRRADEMFGAPIAPWCPLFF